MGTKQRILVVEDDPVIRMGLSSSLKRLGYEVSAMVPSGEEAVKEAAKTFPDLVLMDIKLKGEMDGIEAARIVGSQTGSPVVYVTAHSNADLLERAKRTEPYAYLLKPFSERGLYSTIETALYKHEMDSRVRESEARYRAIVEDQTEFIVRWLVDGTRTFVNGSYCQCFGRSPEELIGSSLCSSIVGDDREALKEKIRTLTPEHPAITDERRMHLPGGEIRRQQWTDRAIFDEQGRIVEMLSVGRNVTALN